MFSSDLCLAVISLTGTIINIKEFKPIYIFKQIYFLTITNNKQQPQLKGRCQKHPDPS